MSLNSIVNYIPIDARGMISFAHWVGLCFLNEAIQCVCSRYLDGGFLHGMEYCVFL